MLDYTFVRQPSMPKRSPSSPRPTGRADAHFMPGNSKVIVPPECTSWVASAGAPQAHAEFDDGKRLYASGTHPEMGSGEKMAALMECIAGVRPWRQHLELPPLISWASTNMSAPRRPIDRENRFPGGSPDQILASMIQGELGAAPSGASRRPIEAAFVELVKWHFQELDFRARTFARAEARVADLTVDRRAGALRATKLWEAVIEARLEAAERLFAFSARRSPPGAPASSRPISRLRRFSSISSSIVPGAGRLTSSTP